MHILFSNLLLFTTVLFVTGCMPMKSHHFYSPSAEGGVVEKSGCNETVGPKDTIEFIRNNVVIEVSAYETENSFGVFLLLEIPRGRQVRLANNYVQITTSSEAGLFEGTIEPIVPYGPIPDQRSWRVEELLVGETTEFKVLLGTATHGKFFAMRADVNMQISDMLTVQLPDLIINGVKFALPEISFKKEKSVEFLVPLNC